MTDEPSPDVRESWMNALASRWTQGAPRGTEFRVLRTGGFAAFLYLIGHKADFRTGNNSRPPGYEYVGRATMTSPSNTRRFYDAAAALGVIELRLTASGRYVSGYTLRIVPDYMLRWDAALAVLKRDTRLVKTAEERERQKYDRQVQEVRQGIQAKRSVTAVTDPARARSMASVVALDPARAGSLEPTTYTEGTLAGFPRATPQVQGPEVPMDPARAGSPEDRSGGVDPARAGSGTLHVQGATLHVQGDPSVPGLAPPTPEPQEDVSNGWDPRDLPDASLPGQRVAPAELVAAMERAEQHVADCTRCDVLLDRKCNEGSWLLFELGELRQDLGKPA